MQGWGVGSDYWGNRLNVTMLDTLPFFNTQLGVQTMFSFYVVGENERKNSPHYWIVCSYTTEEQALYHVDLLEGIIKKAIPIFLMGTATVEPQEWEEYAKEKIIHLDPEILDRVDLSFSSTVDPDCEIPVYSVKKSPLARHVDEFQEIIQGL